MTVELTVGFVRRASLGVMASLVVAVALATATTLHAAASCGVVTGPHDPLARAGVAFVGSVVSASNDQHRALVRVESVWRGPQLPAEVEVESDVLPPPGVGIEDLAIFNPGWRYLFVPENVSQPFKFSSCGGPIQYSSDLDRYRPSATHPPLAASGLGDAIQLVWFTVRSYAAAAIAAVLLLATLVTMLLRRRRRGTLGRLS